MAHTVPRNFRELFQSASDDQRKKVDKVMGEFKNGKLKSSSGRIVQDRDQAVAIALNEAGLSRKD